MLAYPLSCRSFCATNQVKPGGNAYIRIRHQNAQHNKKTITASFIGLCGQIGDYYLVMTPLRCAN